MPHRPTIWALNFVPSAVKFIIALTGYLYTRPRGALTLLKRVIYKLLYRIWEDAGLYREADVSWEVCLMFLWILLLSGNSSSPMSDFLKCDKGWKSVKCCRNTFKKTIMGEDTQRATMSYDQKSRSFNFSVIKFYFFVWTGNMHMLESTGTLLYCKVLTIIINFSNILSWVYLSIKHSFYVCVTLCKLCVFYFREGHCSSFRTAWERKLNLKYLSTV